MEFTLTIVKLRDVHLVVWLHTPVDPPQAEWDRAMSQMKEYAKAKRLAAWELRHVVVTDGGAPNAKQRRQLFDAAKGRAHMLAVVTTVLSNPIKRGIATALQWLNPKIRFYQPAQFDEALSYLGLGSERLDVWAEFGKLQAGMPPNETLRLIASAVGLERIERT